MKNIPKSIYLQVGDEYHDDADFKTLEGVTWSTEKQFSNDIPFVLQQPDDVSNHEQKIWDLVHEWCNQQAFEIPDFNRRQLMERIAKRLGILEFVPQPNSEKLPTYKEMEG